MNIPEEVIEAMVAASMAKAPPDILPPEVVKTHRRKLFRAAFAAIPEPWLLIRVNEEGMREMVERASLAASNVSGTGVLRAEETTADWRDDPSADERWNDGCNFAIVQLANVLGIQAGAFSWDAATETLDGDVQSVIGNALTAAFGDDWRILKEQVSALAAEAEQLRGKQDALRSELLLRGSEIAALAAEAERLRSDQVTADAEIAALKVDRAVRQRKFDALTAENERLREALRPFAAYANWYDGEAERAGFSSCCISSAQESRLTVADLRRARAALAETRE